MKKLYIYTFSVIISFLLLASGNSSAQVLIISDVPTTLCANESFTLSYGGTGSYNPGNVFTAEISTATGAFPGQNIGSLSSTAPTGTIYVSIPIVTYSSTYRIRIKASNSFGVPIVGTNNGVNIDINCTTRDYYWSGGAGNWSDLSHWEYTTDDATFIAATEVPTKNDNVNFDASSFPSGGQLTFDVEANCNDFYWEPGSGANNPVLWSNGNALNVYGDFELASGVYRDLYYIYFRSLKKNVYVNFGDNLIQKDPNTNWQGYIHFSGSGSWDQDSDLIAAQLQITGGGTLFSNDYQYNLNAEMYNSWGTFYAGNSNIYARGMSMYDTFFAESSNIFLQSYQGSITFINGSNTYNNLTVESGNCNVNGSNTYESFSIINGSDIYLSNGSAQTVNNAFTALGSRSNMVVINSSSPGLQATIDVSGASSVSADFVDITDNIIDDGGGGAYSASNAINGGNNTNWTFSLLTPLDYYWTGGTGNWSDASHWNTSADGGTTLVSVTDGPGPIDNIFFPSNSFPGSGKITIDQDVVVNDMTWEPGSGSTNPEIYGNWSERLTIMGDLTMDNGVTRSILDLTFNSSNGINNIDLADNFNAWGNMNFEGGGIWELLSDISSGGNCMNFNEGTLNTNNYSLTMGCVNINSDQTTLNLGSSALSTSSSFSNWASASTINAGTSTLTFYNESWDMWLQGQPIPFANVVIDGILNIEMHNSYDNLTVMPGANLKLNQGTIQTINNGGTLELTGSRSSLVNVETYNTPGVGTFVVTGAIVNADFVSIADNTIDNGLAADVTATNAVDKTGNTGWTLNPIVPFDYYWIGGSGNWTDVAHWQTSPDNGTTFVSASFSPGSVDNIFFTTNSFPSGGVLTFDNEAHCNNMTWQAGSGSSFPRMEAGWNNDLYIHGSLQMADGVTRAINKLVFDSDKTGNTVFLADNLVDWGDIDFQGTGGEWNLTGDLTTAYLNHRSGTLNTNGHTLDIFQRLYIGSEAGAINFGASEVYLPNLVNDADGATMVFNAGTSTFNFDGTNNQSYFGGSYSLTLYDVTIDGEARIDRDFTYNNLTLQEGADLELATGTTQTVNNSFTSIGTRSIMNRISSQTAGSVSTLLVKTSAGGGSATVNVEYTIFTDNTLDNSSAGTDEIAANSLDKGNNSGWDFLTTPLAAFDFYWVGGTGNWSDLSHWATTDGGSTMHTLAPGIIDNVNFTSNSFPNSGEITLDQPASCNNMTWNDGSFNPTIRGDYDNRLTIGGNLTIANGVNRYLQYIEFNSSTTNQITLGDNRHEGGEFAFKGTGTWNLIDGLETGSIQIYGGTLNTNNNDVILDWDFNMHNTDPISLNFGSSQIQAANINNWVWSGNITADVGTSHFTILDRGRFDGQPMGFYDVTFEGEGYVYSTLDVSNNMTITPGGTLMISPSQTLTVGNLIANGTRPSPVTIKSTQDGQQCTISQASGTVSASHIVLQDNIATGGATFNATDAYDKDNNTGWNITPIVGQSYFWMAGTGNWSDRNAWSLTDGSNVIPATAPGPADNVFVTTSSPLNSGGTMNLDIPAECNDMTWSTAPNVGAAIAGDYDSPLTIHGSLTFATGVARNLDHLIFDTDATGNNIDMADNVGNQWINMEFYGSGDWVLQNPLVTSNMQVYGGTLATNMHQLDAEYVYVSQNGTNMPTLDLGSSDVYLNTLNGYNGTLVPGTSTIFLEDNATIYNDWTFNDVQVDGNVWFYGDNSFNNLTILPGSKVQFNANGIQTISQLTAVGLRSRPISILSTNDGEQATILQSSGVVAGQYLTLQDNNALGGASFSAQNSIDNGKVSGWVLTPITPRNYYWVGGDGKWSEFSTHWANADGGTNFFDSSPGPLDNVNFTSNSFPSGGTLTLDFPSAVDNMDWTGSTSNITITYLDDLDNDLTIGGSLTLANGVTRDVNINFDSDDTGNTLFMADNLHTTSRANFYGTGEWTLAGDYEAQRTFLYGGTFNTANFDFVSSRLYLNNDNVSNWGSSNVTLWRFYNYLDTPSTFNSETSTFHFDQPANNFLRGDSRFHIAIFDGNTYFNGNNIFFNGSASAGLLEFAGNQAFNSLTMAAGTSISIGEGTTQTISAALDLNGTEAAPIVINSMTADATGTFSVPPTGVVTANFIHLKDNTATGGATFAATNSSDFGNVTGWTGLLTGQTIDFGPLSDQTMAAGAFNVSATATSSLTVSYEIAAGSSGSATISGNTVTPTASGLVGVRAIQAGDVTYGSALPSTRYIHIDATSEPNELGDMKEAKLALGQPDAQSSDAVYTDLTIPEPWQAAVSSTGKLAIAAGARVMIWNQIPATYGTPADVVVGQPDFTTDRSNVVSASTFSGDRVYSIAFTHDDKMLASDEHRVLIWNVIPTTNGASADLVIGQDDFVSTKEGTGDNRFGGDFKSITTYYDATTQTEKLLITDFPNSRVLVYNSMPISNGASADIVIGQPDFNSSTAGSGADQLSNPVFSEVTPDGKLLIPDFMNHRILVYNTIPIADGTSANVVLGQTDFDLVENGLGPNSYTNPTSVSVSRTGKLAIADYGNQRVLIYNTIPTDNTTPPDYVLGQPDFLSNAINYNSISGRSLYYPINVSWDFSNNLFIADNQNNRVLLYGAADLDAPVPSNPIFPTTFIDGQSASAAVTLTDRSGISSAEVYYRGLSSANPVFSMAPLTNDGTNDVWSFDASFNPANNNERLGMEYYVMASDGVGNILDGSGSKVNANIQYTNGLPITNFGVGNSSENYRMFSVPLDLVTDDAKNVFNEITSGTYDNSKLRMYSFPGGTGTTYTEYGAGFTKIDLGKGYFALAATSASVSSGQGATRVDGTNPFPITLVPGWNMIGNPYNFTVVWADVLTASGLTAAQAQTPQGYTGSYADKTSIASGEAVFVNNPTTGNVTLSIPVTNNSGGRIMDVEDNVNSLADKSWEVRFLKQDNDGYDIVLGAVGMEENSLPSFDEHDRINPPPLAEQPKVEFNHPEFFQPSFKKDIRTSSNNEQWNFVYTAQPNDDLDEIYWDNSYYGYSSPDIYLVDKTHFEVINMKEKDSYQFEHAGETKFEVYFGEDVLAALLPDQIDVQSPFPNPFNEAIRLNVGLPLADNEYKVIVDIYNTMGKKVATLTNSILKAGYYNFNWQGTNDSGQVVPNGIYAYRIAVIGDINKVVAGKIVKE